MDENGGNKILLNLMPLVPLRDEKMEQEKGRLVNMVSEVFENANKIYDGEAVDGLKKGLKRSLEMAVADGNGNMKFIVVQSAYGMILRVGLLGNMTESTKNPDGDWSQSLSTEGAVMLEGDFYAFKDGQLETISEPGLKGERYEVVPGSSGQSQITEGEGNIKTWQAVMVSGENIIARKGVGTKVYEYLKHVGVFGLGEVATAGQNNDNAQTAGN
jgi:hypothetical protein